MSPERKTCGKCGKRRFVSQFYKNKNGKKGLTACCKKCVDERAKARKIVKVYDIESEDSYVKKVDKRLKRKARELEKEEKKRLRGIKVKREVKVKTLQGRDFIRERIRALDKYKCRLCGREWKVGERRFDVHHLEKGIGNERSYSYSAKEIKKLITLDHTCHTSIIHPMLKERGCLTREVFDKIRESGKVRKRL
jgi:hypothetical protein